MTVICCFLLYSTASGDEHTYQMPSMVVTEKSTERVYDVPSYSRLSLPESSTAESVFTAKDIEIINPETVFDMIALAPNIIRTFSTPMNPDGLRSRGGEIIGLIIDGIYIPSTQSTRMLENFPVTIIDSIRIVRDSTALTLGPLSTISSSTKKPNAAVEGYIIITTKRPKQKSREIRLEYDTAQTMQASGALGDVKNEWYYSFAFNHVDTPEWDDHNDAEKSDSFHLRSGYTGERFLANISLYADLANWECARLDNDGVLGEAIWKFEPSNTFMFNFDMARLWNKNNTTTFSFGYSQVKSTLLEDYTDKNASVLKHGEYTEWHLDEKVLEYNVGHTLSMASNRLKIGAQAIFWDMLDMQGWQYRDKEEEGFGFYITDEYWVNQKLTLDAGVRIDRRHTIKQNDPNFDDTWAENNTSFAFGPAYRFNSVYKLTSRFSYSHQPAYDWLLKNDDSKSFDSDTRRKYEVGISADYGTAFNLGCSLFYYDIKNYKYVAKSQSNSVTGEIDYYYDSADITQKGLEIGVSGELSDHFSYNATYAYLNIDDLSVSRTLPKNSATVILNYKNGDYNCNVTTKHLGEYSQSSTNGDGLGDYVRVDLSVSKRLADKSKITLYGRNITDDQYAEAYMNGVVSGMSGYLYNRGAILGIEYSKVF